MTNFNMIKLDATASSNDWLKNRFLSGDCSDGDVVWVKNQTHGRGQMNKIWQSEPQKNLTFSLFKVFPKPSENSYKTLKKTSGGPGKRGKKLKKPSPEAFFRVF